MSEKHIFVRAKKWMNRKEQDDGRKITLSSIRGSQHDQGKCLAFIEIEQLYAYRAGYRAGHIEGRRAGYFDACNSGGAR